LSARRPFLYLGGTGAMRCSFRAVADEWVSKVRALAGAVAAP
jgi:hypothetical protein